MAIKICKNGHKFNKSSDCPVCPVCYAEDRKQIKEDDFRSKLSAPAQRALKNAGINQIKDLSKFTEKEVSGLHGFGPSGMKRLKIEMKKGDVNFKLV